MAAIKDRHIYTAGVLLGRTRGEKKDMGVDILEHGLLHIPVLLQRQRVEE